MWNAQNNPLKLTPNTKDETALHTTRMEMENIQPVSCNSDLSLYGSSNLERPVRHDSTRRTLEEHDPNSRDSGYGSGYSQGNKPVLHSVQLHMNTLSKSFKSMSSIDEEFLEFCDLEPLLTDKLNLPSDFNCLISGPFTPTSSSKITPGHDFPIHSLLKNSKSDKGKSGAKVRCYLSKTNDIPCIPPKRSKLLDEANVKEPAEEAVVPVLPASEESIKCALQRSSSEPNLIGDFSKPYCLPLVSGRIMDLKSISPATLALLINGSFSGVVKTYKIIDCRYPYEFEGGHITGAINIYTKEQLQEKLLHFTAAASTDLNTQERHILVFHCEFSSNRGPNLYRFLRNCDRNANKHVYPALHYPEMYLLDGGYKNFYNQCAELCLPKAYVPMNHPKYHNDLVHFKERSKTWAAERSYLNNSNSLKRLSFA